MSDAFRLSLVVEHADGTETRWGPDELDAHDVPTGLQFSTTIPGGFSDLSCDLLRQIDKQHPDQNLFDSVTVYAAGNQPVWEGRFQQFPRQTSDGYTVSPGAEGWVAHLRDNQTFREIYVDRALSKWGETSVERRLALIVSGSSPQSPQVTPGATAPALAQEITGAWTTGGFPTHEAYYDTGGLDIGSVYYAWKKSSTISEATADWHWALLASTDDLATTVDTTGELRAAGPGTGTLTAGAGRKYALSNFYFGAVGGTQGMVYGLYWTCLAVYGTHGLTKQGTSDATTAQGFYASDVIADAVSRAAPLLTFTTGTDGSIQPTSIVLDQLAFDTPTTAEEVVKRCNNVHLWDWGVENNRTFFFRPSSPDRLTWTVRLQDGAHLQDDGPAAQDLINGVVVAYTDPSGRRRYAGPVGSGCHVEDASLSDSTSSNAATAHGIAKKWATLELSNPTTDATAVNIGAIYLAERSVPQHRGQAVITGMAQHPTKGLRPAFEIRAGAYIQFVDALDDSISQPRRIIRTDYNHDQRRNTLALDSTPYTLESLLALLDAQLVNA